MKLALHRSITFWSGILVMGFIGWVWWDSLSSSSVIAYQRQKISCNIGGLSYSQNSHYGNGTLETNRSPLSNTFKELRHEWFPRPYWIRGGGPPEKAGPGTQSIEEWHREWISTQAKGVRLLRVPLWLLMVGFGLPWIGLLLWRARRRRMRMTDEVSTSHS